MIRMLYFALFRRMGHVATLLPKPLCTLLGLAAIYNVDRGALSATAAANSSESRKEEK